MGAAVGRTAGSSPGVDAVTLFAGEGVRGVVDQLSRDAGVAGRTFAGGLRGVGPPQARRRLRRHRSSSRPSTRRVFREAGWTAARLIDELDARC